MRKLEIPEIMKRHIFWIKGGERGQPADLSLRDLRKYKFDRKTKRWVDNGVAYTKGRVDSRGYVTPNIM